MIMCHSDRSQCGLTHFFMGKKKNTFFKIIIIKLKTKIGHLKSNVDSAILMAVGCIYIYCQSFLFHHWLDRCMYFAILYSNNTYLT